LINFACKDIDITDLIKCSFGLNKTSCRLLLKMLKINKSLSVEELAKSMGVDRTTIQKALKILIDSKLVLRKQRNLDNGGYIFLYDAQDKEEIKQRMIKDIGCWTKNAKNEVESW
jgi:predicted transcriptional regulator